MGERAHGRDAAHWDARYAALTHDHSAGGDHDGPGTHGASGERRRDHGPSGELVATLDGVAPGRALDLGAGTGRHAIWLARAGWQVTAVDFSPVAVDLGREGCTRAGVADQVDWVVADATTWEPVAGTAYDLVLMTYFHVDADVVRRLGAWLVPGGRLVVIGHALRNLVEGTGGPSDPSILNTPESLRDKAAGLVVERCEEVVRPHGHGDQIDVVLVARAPARPSRPAQPA